MILQAATQADIAAAQNAATTMASTAVNATDGKFVFLANFDGTNNDLAEFGLNGFVTDKDWSGSYATSAGDPLPTNVGEFHRLAAELAETSHQFKTKYYNGPGSDGTRIGSSILPEAELNSTAETAYSDFLTAVENFKESNPHITKEQLADMITVAATGFSRGCATAVAFCQLLNERGLTIDGQVIIPGTNHDSKATGVSVAGLFLLDPVSTGYSDSLLIPLNVNADNCVTIRAKDELRYMFKADDFNDARMEYITVPGNHCDIGGGYADAVLDGVPVASGISAIVLQGQVNFFKGIGIPLGELPSHRQYQPGADVFIHTEGRNAFDQVIWSESGDYGTARLTKNVNSGPVLDFAVVYTKESGSLDIAAEWTHQALKFEANSSEVIFYRDGLDLVFKVQGPEATDSVRVLNYYNSPEPLLAAVVFDDRRLNIAELAEAPKLPDPVAPEQPTVPQEPAVVYGTDGNDSAYGTDLNDIFYGSLGNDTLTGGAGDDQYFYNSGDGHDTLILGPGHDTLNLTGLSAKNLSVQGSAQGITFTDTRFGKPIITIQDLFETGTSASFTFADGSSLAYTDSNYSKNQAHFIACDKFGFVEFDSYALKNVSNARMEELPSTFTQYSWSTPGYESTSIYDTAGGKYWDYFGKNSASGESWHYLTQADGSGFANINYTNGDYWKSVTLSENNRYHKYETGGNKGYSVTSDDFYLSESLNRLGGYNFTYFTDEFSYVFWRDSSGVSKASYSDLVTAKTTTVPSTGVVDPALAYAPDVNIVRPDFVGLNPAGAFYFL